MSQAERIIREVWASYGGVGDPPKLIVTPDQHERFLEAGLPEKMMAISEPLPESDPK